MSSEERPSTSILTPDQRLRVFVSSTMKELLDERRAAERAIGALHLHPVMFELGARPHPPRDLYRSYLQQSQIFVGVYWQSYGWIGPGMSMSGIEDEFRLAAGMPRLVYVKEPAADRDPRLTEMLSSIREEGGLSYKSFSSPAELERLLANDLAILLTERFTGAGTPPSEDLPVAPVTRTSFVGREQELGTICKMLRSPEVWLLTLWGSGGMGKTRLALEAAKACEADFPDGTAVVWLDAISDHDLVLQAIAAKLDIREVEDRSLFSAIGDRIRGKTLLLMLDNFEHVIEAAPMIPDLLALPGGTKCLVTSRTILGVRGEHAVEIEPLPVPLEGDAPGGSSVTASVQLFVDRAAAASPSFRLTAENASAVGEICRRLEGIPLALELAAARIRMLTPHAIVERLDSRLDLLKSGPRDLPERQRTIRSMVSWSYELLEEREKDALERLSVFAGGIYLEAAHAVLENEDIDESIEVMGSLVDKSLVRRIDPDEVGVRFRMLEMIAEYGRERLIEHAERGRAKDLHAEHFLRKSELVAAELNSPKGTIWYDYLERESENVQAALGWFVESGRIDDGLQLAVNLQWFWWIRGHFSVAEYWLTRLLERGGSPHLRARGMVSAGLMTSDLGQRDRSRRFFEDAAEALDDLGDVDGKAWAESGLGHVLFSLGEVSDAEDLQRSALTGFLATKDLLGQCNANTRLATIASARGDYEKTEKHLERSLAARRALKDPWGTGYVLNALGAIRLKKGDPDAALRDLTEALPLLRLVGSKESIARCLSYMGQVAALRDDWVKADSLFRESLQINRDIGAREGVSLVLLNVGRAALEIGNASEAIPLYEECYEIGIELEDGRAVAGALEGLASVAERRGNGRLAARLLGAADGVREAKGFARLGPLTKRTEQQIVTGTDLDTAEFERVRAAAREMGAQELAGAIASLTELPATPVP